MSRADKLMRHARSTSSLQDFGDDSFREGLEILVKAVDTEADFNELGKAAFDSQIVEVLRGRLQVEHWYREHPEIEDQQIVAPLIGMGLPRTGSTALSFLLAEDPAVRAIRHWEAINPCPPPQTATEWSDPRIEVARRQIERSNLLYPRKKTMLPGSPTGPMECQTYMAYDFKAQLFQALARIPSYVDWLNHRADLVPAYRYVKRVLKLLQWRCPPTRWRLRNPSNIVFIDALAQVFPDARFWMTHRDVTEVIPSVADLYYEFQRAFCDRVDKTYLGQMNADWCELGMRRVIAFREAGNEDRFFDIQFAPFQRDPFPILQQLYRFLGEELTPEALARMRKWREQTPREQHGEHTYQAADFGLSAAGLRERFRFYSQRFNVLPAPIATHLGNT